MNRVAEEYNRLLEDLVVIPVVPEGFYSSWAQYTIQLEDRVTRDRVQKELKEKEIPTMIYYPKPMHEQKAFADVRQYVECPVTEQLCNTVLSLPMHPYMTTEQITFIVDHIRNILK